MSELTGPVEIVGAGLIGTSIALACRRAGLEVLLTDPSDDHLRTASGLGAGRPSAPGDRPQLVVVAVPPDHLAEQISRALTGDAVVTDVGSVKAGPLAALAGSSGTSAGTRWPAASAPARWRRARRCSTGGRGP
jgi:prephenate dehydrogenase